jgi:hypothetical protein
LQATIGELRGLVDSNTNRLNVHDGDIGGINGRVGTNEYNIQVNHLHTYVWKGPIT